MRAQSPSTPQCKSDHSSSPSTSGCKPRGNKKASELSSRAERSGKYSRYCTTKVSARTWDAAEQIRNALAVLWARSTMVGDATTLAPHFAALLQTGLSRFATMLNSWIYKLLRSCSGPASKTCACKRWRAANFLQAPGRALL